MEVGLVGKPNVGKSTMYKALTLADAEIANFPFTTIKANFGVGYVSSQCPCKSLGLTCSPKNGICRNHTRYTPVRVIDVAGLVPGAHMGKGLGNQFLDDLRQADVLIHVVDISGSTDEKGEPTKGHDPEKDIHFLENEVDMWFGQVVKRNWAKVKNKIKYENKNAAKELVDILSGLGVKEHHIKDALESTGLGKSDEWSDEDCMHFGKTLRENSKPIVIAANKVDQGAENYERLKESYDMFPVCAEAELALREADQSGLIDYVPGSNAFELKGEVEEKKTKALKFIREKILDVWGSTGVQAIINHAVYEKLALITVYPVENEAKYTDKKGNILPDSYLMKKDSTTLDLAYKIHTEIGDKFITAVDCRSKMKVAKDHRLNDQDIIKIVSDR